MQAHCTLKSPHCINGLLTAAKNVPATFAIDFAGTIANVTGTFFVVRQSYSV